MYDKIREKFEESFFLENSVKVRGKTNLMFIKILFWFILLFLPDYVFICSNFILIKANCPVWKSCCSVIHRISMIVSMIESGVHEHKESGLT